MGCDLVIFLVFNEFQSCEGGGTDGHEFSGIAQGGACEGTYGSGYVVAVDQGRTQTAEMIILIAPDLKTSCKIVHSQNLPGYLGEHWVGPQVLAHHILLDLTQDLYATPGSKEKRGCLNPKSILHESVYPGEQFRDACVESKLRRSKVAHRSCVLNSNYCPNCPLYLDAQDFNF